MNLRTRVALTASAAVALIVVTLTLAAFFVVRHELNRELDASVSREAGRTKQLSERQGWAPSGACEWLAAPACTQIVDASGKSSAPDGYALPVTAKTLAVARGSSQQFYSDVRLGNLNLRMVTVPLSKKRALQVAVRSDTVDTGVRRTGLVLLFVGGIAVVLAGGLGYLVARTGLRPVRRVTRAAEEIAATRDARTRIEVTGTDELARLATSFNTMLEELEASVTAQRQLVADASHELRSPLTSLRTNISLLAYGDRLPPEQRERAVRALDRELAGMTGLVRDLVDLARGEEPPTLVEDVPLAGLVEHCAETARRHWPAVGFVVRTEYLLVPGVPERLTRLVGNLLDNAAKFSPPGLPVEVSLTAGGVLTVRDHGPGVSPEDLPYLFDRFYRSRAARALPGSGLGLAMARQIARAHGAELTAANAAGGGALFTLRFSS